jgi:hypothetical protein
VERDKYSRKSGLRSVSISKLKQKEERSLERARHEEAEGGWRGPDLTVDQKVPCVQPALRRKQLNRGFLLAWLVVDQSLGKERN